MLDSLKRRVLRFILRTMFRLIPNHGKRLMWLVSIYYMLVHLNYREKVELAYLNKHMTLAKDVESLRLPLNTARLLWTNDEFSELMGKGVTDISKVDSTIKEETARRIVRATPKWLKYGDDLHMVTELLTLFRA